jgi:hypothetical protein
VYPHQGLYGTPGITLTLYVNTETISVPTIVNGSGNVVKQGKKSVRS